MKPIFRLPALPDPVSFPSSDSSTMPTDSIPFEHLPLVSEVLSDATIATAATTFSGSSVATENSISSEFDSLQLTKNSLKTTIVSNT